MKDDDLDSIKQELAAHLQGLADKAQSDIDARDMAEKALEQMDSLTIDAFYMERATDNDADAREITERNVNAVFNGHAELLQYAKAIAYTVEAKQTNLSANSPIKGLRRFNPGMKAAWAISQQELLTMAIAFTMLRIQHDMQERVEAPTSPTATSQVNINGDYDREQKAICQRLVEKTLDQVKEQLINHRMGLGTDDPDDLSVASSRNVKHAVFELKELEKTKVTK